jgi:hypothetical protein
MEPHCFRPGGRYKRLAFGVYPDVTLKMAREKRDSARQRVKGAKPEIILRASDREVNAPEETYLEVVRHVAAVRPTPRRWIDVRAVI